MTRADYDQRHGELTRRFFDLMEQRRGLPPASEQQAQCERKVLSLCTEIDRLNQSYADHARPCCTVFIEIPNGADRERAHDWLCRQGCHFIWASAGGSEFDPDEGEHGYFVPAEVAMRFKLMMR